MKNLLLLILLIALTSCAPAGPKNAADVAGEYIYKYKSGHVEVIILSSDLRFRHYLYLNEDAYAGRVHALYTNEGVWSYDRTTLSADHWLEFFNLRNIVKPADQPTDSEWNVFWNAPSGGEEATINDAVDLGYIFVRAEK